MSPKRDKRSGGETAFDDWGNNEAPAEQPSGKGSRKVVAKGGRLRRMNEVNTDVFGGDLEQRPTPPSDDEGDEERQRKLAAELEAEDAQTVAEAKAKGIAEALAKEEAEKKVKEDEEKKARELERARVEAAEAEAHRAREEASRKIEAAKDAAEKARVAQKELAEATEEAKEVRSEFLGASEAEKKDELSNRMKEAEDALQAARGKAEKTSIADAKAFEAAEGAEAEAAKKEQRAADVKAGSDPASGAPFRILVSPAHTSPSDKTQSPAGPLLAAMAAVGLDTPETREYVKAAEEQAARAAEEGSDPAYAGMTAAQKKVVARLEGNQEHIRLMEIRFQDDVAALREKYDRLMEPVFEERAAILSGQGKEEGGNEANGSAANEGFQVGTRALPGFWLRVLERQPLLASLLGVRDKPLLLYLRNIRRVLHMRKEDGFTLVFEFDENPFFTPATLTKTFKMKLEDDDWIVSETVGTPIVWKQNMDVTKSVIVRKQRNVRTKGVRVVHEEQREKSFFSFFENSVVPEDSELEAMSEAEQKEVFDKLKLEYDAGVNLRDLIIPHAVDWYLGAAEESEDEEQTEESESERGTRVPAPAKQSTEGALTEEAAGITSWFGF